MPGDEARRQYRRHRRVEDHDYKDGDDGNNNDGDDECRREGDDDDDKATKTHDRTWYLEDKDPTKTAETGTE